MQPFPLFVVIFFGTLRTSAALRNALSSQPPLRCCFMQEPPISFQNNRSRWNVRSSTLFFTHPFDSDTNLCIFTSFVEKNGLDGVIRDHLLQHQSYLNWTCSSMLPFRHSSTDFNAFVSSMYECTNKSTGEIIDAPNCMCDIGIGGWFRNTARFGKVTFLPPFGYDRYVVFTHVSQATVSGKVWFFLQTFDFRAWICIVASFVMFTFLKMLDRRFQPAPPCPPLPPTTNRIRRYVHYLRNSRPLYRLRKAIQSTLMRMILLSDEPVVTSGTTTRQWFLNMILAVASLFLILSYEASMTALLVQESIQTRFQTASDLQHCKIDPSEMCIIRGGALETYWNKSIAIGDCHLENPPNYFDSYKSLFAAVQNGQCKYAMVGESVITAAIRERYCGDFVIVGEPIFNDGLSMLLPIGSNLTEPMSLATLALHGNQTEPSLKKYFNTLPQCEADVTSTLSFGKLRYFFFILFSFGGLILLAMVLIPQHAPRDSGSPQTRATQEEQLLEPKMMRSWNTHSGEARGVALRHGLSHNWLMSGVEEGKHFSRVAPRRWRSGRLWGPPSGTRVLKCANCCWQCATNHVGRSWYGHDSEIDCGEVYSDDESV